MKRTTIAATTLALTAPVAIAAPAHADTCVQQGEYGQVEYDMRKATVHGIFDGYLGEFSYYDQAGGTEYDERYYDPCWLGAGQWAVIMYSKPVGSGYWRVQWKAIQ